MDFLRAKMAFSAMHSVCPRKRDASRRLEKVLDLFGTWPRGKRLVMAVHSTIQSLQPLTMFSTGMSHRLDVSNCESGLEGGLCIDMPKRHVRPELHLVASAD